MSDTTQDLSEVILDPDLKKLEQYNDYQAGDFIPTMDFRIAVPSGTHMPDQQKLQQKWLAPTIGGGHIESWRDIKKVVVDEIKTVTQG